MRRTKLLSVLGGLAGLAFATSCDSFLDPSPSDVLAPENFYKTSSDAVAAVNGVYEQVKWSYWLGFWYMSDIATDDILVGPRFGSDGHRMGDYIFDATEWPMGDMWGNAYRTINRANAVLDRVPAITMDTTLRARLLNEARFLRALAYFNLVRYFGDVPLLEHEVTSLSGLAVSRTPAAQVYPLIVSDLQAAAAALPASYSGADVGRATSGAARALLAKVYLTQQDWANAAQTAGQLITSGRYALLANWKDIFKIATEIINSESIFEINYDGTLDPGAGSVHTLFSIPSGYPGGDAYGLMYIPPSLQNLFAVADKRGNNGTFMTSPHTDQLGRVVTWTDPPGPAFNKYLDEADEHPGVGQAIQQLDRPTLCRCATDVRRGGERRRRGDRGQRRGGAERRPGARRYRAGVRPVPNRVPGFAAPGAAARVRLRRAALVRPVALGGPRRGDPGQDHRAADHRSGGDDRARRPEQPAARAAVGARHQPQSDAESGLVILRGLLWALAASVACAPNGRAPGEVGPESPGQPSGPAVEVWLTTADASKLLSRESDAHFDSGPAPSITTIAVDEGTTYQAIVGFGAAITDASAWLLQNRMTPSQREALLQELFGRNPGIGLSFTRLTMGASDFSLRQYSYDDMPAGQTDPTLAHFSIDPNRADVLPVVRRALAINPELKIMASPWSPPGWMKTSGSLIQGTLLPEAYGPLADYLRRYIEAYAGEGVPIYAITVQNEPHYEPSDYPGMRLEPPARARFVGGYLGPLLASAGIRTLILDWDHNWDEYTSPLQVLADSVAPRYIAGIAWHCYGGDVSAQTLVHDAHPEKDAYFTECSGGEWAANFADNLKWFVRTLIIGSTRGWAKGVLLWNLALDEQHGPHSGGCGNCRGVVTINSASGAVSRNVEYYVLAHASRFARPGGHRIASTSGIEGLESVAFRNADDGSKALIVVNTAAQQRSFAVRWAGQSFSSAIPAGAVVTFYWKS